MNNKASNNKASAGRFFEDFSLGEQIYHATPRTITESDAALYLALTGSRFSLYCNQEFAKRLGFKASPIDNFLVFHIAFGKTVNDISLNAVANLGYAELQFYIPTFAGDTLSVMSEVIGLKENSNGKTGIVYVQSKALNQNGHTVLSWKRWVMVHKREQQMLNSFEVKPQLDPKIALDSLSVPLGYSSQNYDPQVSGEKYVLNDYQLGEWIDHIDGISIDDTQHTMATNLYQNNAKVHFNQHQMSNSRHGQRLVYGGHVISLCRTVSHNGLANAQWLSAINAGSHLNPTYAGDTIYAASQVLEKQNLGSGVGVLQLRTLGFKNIQWQAMQSQFEMELDGKKSFHPQLVLDLNYSVLIPA
ncbi:MaoC family dehydratase [Kangiella sp. TOML190]|uniref:MaoC family dehydratase n=1 Tax=Kangiella sp. TOML190 TaxID=2931351 RepID=UPI00203F59B2|nr:MaoC family dehydratase [Kangiella sp. TOML190]